MSRRPPARHTSIHRANSRATSPRSPLPNLHDHRLIGNSQDPSRSNARAVQIVASPPFNGRLRHENHISPSAGSTAAVLDSIFNWFPETLNTQEFVANHAGEISIQSGVWELLRQRAFGISDAEGYYGPRRTDSGRAYRQWIETDYAQCDLALKIINQLILRHTRLETSNDDARVIEYLLNEKATIKLLQRTIVENMYFAYQERCRREGRQIPLRSPFFSTY
ncbi:hypothetical protein BT63DRAFT_240216 [Microthyrium microscopicum]|uniref:Uncharacterized protein n=1 Tax=Microthyrium microscopicum TaxID=703497 RepID=A0A6A6UFV5_9PEZI|nr:hypothetical protein BT63DRAFT_240216 [Microthyrium microscopicum]